MKYDERAHWNLCAQLATSPVTSQARTIAAINGQDVFVWHKPYCRPVIATNAPSQDWNALGVLRHSVPTSQLTVVVHRALQSAELYDGTDAPLATEEPKS